jgi:hypothetical protein
VVEGLIEHGALDASDLDPRYMDGFKDRHHEEIAYD